MRRLKLTTLLIVLNAGLVVVAVVGVAAGAVRVLRQLADQQAMARVSLAAVSAQQAVERSGKDVLTYALVLADRPNLGRILQTGNRAALTAFLERFRRTSRLSACAVLVGGRRFASSKVQLPWDELRRAGGGRSLVAVQDGSLVLAASAPVPAMAGVEVLTALALDRTFARRIGGQIGLPVTVLGSRAAREESSPAALLRNRALDASEAVAGRVDAGGLYLAVRPLFDPSGAVAGLVETGLPASGIDASVAQLVGRLLLLAVGVAALVSLLSAAAGRWLGTPVRQLTSAAASIGRGDLTTPIPKAPGVELGALATTLEETRRELLRLTAELRRRQAEGEAILTGIAEGVFSVDRDRRIQYLNPQTAALLGVEPAAAIGRFCGDVLNPQGTGGSRPCEDGCPIVHARFRGGARSTERLLLADGTRRTVVITSVPPVEERQFQVLRDETDLESARRQRDAVLANISHEFKTPLAAQSASIELLRERLLERPGGDVLARDEVEALVLALERGGLRLTQLIDNLLESVRIESGQHGIRSHPVALDEIVEEAVELTAPLVAQRGQRLAVDLPFPLPAVQGDAPRLTQVFVNLIANANKFAPSGSALRIGGEVEDRAVALWVDDEGPGLPAAEEAQAIFRPFVRADGGRGEPEQSGMGLGLWIVQSIVERHGGSIEAQRLGEGTRMRITLPRQGAGGARQ
jgi:signal transduction histidine kinase